MQTISEYLGHELIDNSVSEIEELKEALRKTKSPVVCRAIQNEIDNITISINQITQGNLLH